VAWWTGTAYRRAHPTTLAETTLAALRPGDRVNNECRVCLAKYVERLVSGYLPRSMGRPPPVPAGAGSRKAVRRSCELPGSTRSTTGFVHVERAIVDWPPARRRGGGRQGPRERGRPDLRGRNGRHPRTGVVHRSATPPATSGGVTRATATGWTCRRCTIARGTASVPLHRHRWTPSRDQRASPATDPRHTIRLLPARKSHASDLSGLQRAACGQGGRRAAPARDSGPRRPGPLAGLQPAGHCARFVRRRTRATWPRDELRCSRRPRPGAVTSPELIATGPVREAGLSGCEAQSPHRTGGFVPNQLRQRAGRHREHAWSKRRDR